ncbi:unnamed protein product [Kluyveromyces dobzhanskii CBS 2104]|uniref:WGS project CCBQ000000000 data, contig 00058 n=1 Tax=Kluyveromyces dobzhanskii CBS 2104 TaxID=1427455 RepID=A0A0A8LBF2_9SACH|nr:unnamed protein product [Kluyveromyces dobzhanskii CBS 2104]
MPNLRDIAVDMVNFTVSNVNDAISFKPHLCKEVPQQQYNALKNWYIEFTGTSIRKNKCRLFFLPVNVSDELQQLNPVIPDEVKITSPTDSRVIYYKNRLITELDFENVKRVQRACIYIAYAAVNQLLNLETDPSMILETSQSNGTANNSGNGTASLSAAPSHANADGLDPMESCHLSLKRGEVLGFRELGHLISITPWHFHRVFKVITGLTIREYGQLCVEFLKKNCNLVTPVRARVTKFKEAGDSYSCLDDQDFMNDDTVKYECDENCVVLPDYFIDLTKSKESKRKSNDSPPSTGTSSCSANNKVDQIGEMNQSKNASHSTTGLSRSEQRKRRSSAMIQKIRNASLCTVSSNPSIQSALNNPGSPIGGPNFHNLTPSPENEQSQLNGADYAPYLRHPSTSTIGLRRKSKASRKGSVAAMETIRMVSKPKHKRNVSDPIANGVNRNEHEFLDGKMSHDESLNNGSTMDEGTQQSLAEAFTFPSPQVAFKFNMFDEPNMNMNMDMNINSTNLSEMALNSISMNLDAIGALTPLNPPGNNFGGLYGSAAASAPTTADRSATTASTTDLDLSLPIDDVTEMSALSLNSNSQFQYVHTDKLQQQQAQSRNFHTGSMHLDGSTFHQLSEPQSLSSTLPTTPQDVNALLPLQGHDSLLMEFSPEESANVSTVDPLFPLYPSSMLTAVPSDAFATYEDFIAN